jgi:hypothetical protein
LHALNPGIFEIGGADEKIMISDPYPDPASEIICLNIRSTADLRLKVNVYSVIGQEMLSLDFNISAGLNTARIPVGSIPEGMYFIVPGIQDGSISTVRKFLKR